jgi:hypothetical protein
MFLLCLTGCYYVFIKLNKLSIFWDKIQMTGIPGHVSKGKIWGTLLEPRKTNA